MKISTNMIGNYNPQVYNGSVKNAKNAEPQFKLESKPVDKKTVNNLSSAEKDYFVKLYPQNKNEIIDYHAYEKTGKMSGVKIGSMFDKRG
ncbi:MAG TPA: hypothetical protein VMV32_04050 [Ignavibacteriaceae bacterium]|nr:hypothetical protein [Ignavibacteriaceae bacterium]